MCTGIKLKSNDNAVVYGRTLEFGKDLESQILMIPRNFKFAGTAPENKTGLTWQSKYAVLGANACNMLQFVDGVNEVGLAGGLFYFPGYAEYQDITEQEVSISIAPWELLTWILTNFASVDEVKQMLPTIKVTNCIFGPWNMVLPVHLILHDEYGSLVVEYTNGKLSMHSNPLGVLTNAPGFDWHITNLNNYIGLSYINHKPITLDGVLLKSFGQGSGLFGLPGDFTPSSRFVRAVVFSQAIKNLATGTQARDSAFHILNLFDIPKGIIRDEHDDATHYDHTQWTSLCDLSDKKYYFHTYDNNQIRMVDLMQMNRNSTSETFIPMKSAQSITDLTPY